VVRVSSLPRVLTLVFRPPCTPQGLLIEDVHEVFAAHWFWKRLGVVAHNKDIEGRPSIFGGVHILRASVAHKSTTAAAAAAPSHSQKDLVRKPVSIRAQPPPLP